MKMTKKSKKRALISSLVVMAICFTMLIGTTFAWFTDSASSTGNVITTGTLDVKLTQKDANGNYTEVSGPVFDDVLWEPNATYVEYFRIENAGSLALKFGVALNVTGVTKNLNEVLEYAVVEGDNVTGWTSGTAVAVGNNVTTIDGLTLAPAATYDFALVVHMDHNAGNTYQDASITFDVNVAATQATYESDSFDNQYDAGADATVVATADALVAALANGGEIALGADVALTDTVNIEKDTVIYLNGNTFDASANASRPFNVADGVSLTINATGADVKVGAYGFVNIPAGNNANVTINGGNFTANTDNGSFIKARGTGVINVTLNNVNYTDTSSNGGWIANAVENNIVGNFTLNVNGGNYDVYNGFSSVETLTVTGVNLTVKNVGVYNSSGTAVVDNCTITCTTQNTATEQANAPASCVSVSSNLDIVVKNSTLISNSEATAVYTSGGTVVIENCNVTGAYAHYTDNTSYPTAEYKTTVDGVEVSAVVH